MFLDGCLFSFLQYNILKQIFLFYGIFQNQTSYTLTAIAIKYFKNLTLFVMLFNVQVYCTYCSECVAGRRRERKKRSSEGKVFFLFHNNDRCKTHFFSFFKPNILITGFYIPVCVYVFASSSLLCSNLIDSKI